LFISIQFSFYFYLNFYYYFKCMWLAGKIIFLSTFLSVAQVQSLLKKRCFLSFQPVSTGSFPHSQELPPPRQDDASPASLFGVFWKKCYKPVKPTRKIPPLASLQSLQKGELVIQPSASGVKNRYTIAFHSSRGVPVIKVFHMLPGDRVAFKVGLGVADFNSFGEFLSAIDAPVSQLELQQNAAREQGCGEQLTGPLLVLQRRIDALARGLDASELDARLAAARGMLLQRAGQGAYPIAPPR
jgi:hypothetical protein